MTNVEKIAEDFSKKLSFLDAYDVVEVIANVLIFSGIARMALPEKISDITPENVIDLVMQDKKNNGETLYNALAHQGLVMLMWLRKGK